MHFKRKNPATVKKSKKAPTTKVLNEYTFCKECRSVLVKKVFKKYKYEPYCQECRALISNARNNRFEDVMEK